MPSQSTSPTYHIPNEVTLLILAHCDSATRYAILRTDRANYNLALPFLYEHITLYTPKQLRCLAESVQAVSSSCSLPNHFKHTTAFTYALTARSPTAVQTDLNLRLYNSLARIPYFNRTEGSEDPEPLFPNLKTAYFYPLPMLESEPQPLTSFLAGIQHLHLLHHQDTAYDSMPHLPSLGIDSLQTLHIYHLLGAELYSAPSHLNRYLGFQNSLASIDFQLQAYCEYALESIVTRQAEGCSPQTPGAGELAYAATAYTSECAQVIASVLQEIVFGEVVVPSRGFSLVWTRWTPNLNLVSLTIPLEGREGLSQETLPGLVRYELASMWEHALNSPHIPSRAVPRSLPLIVLNTVGTTSTEAGRASRWELPGVGDEAFLREHADDPWQLIERS